MYERDTVLTLKEPADEGTAKYAYNTVRVVGTSPVSHGNKGGWTGSDASGVIIVPLTDFGPTLDEPFGKLRQLYDVLELPTFEPAPPALVKQVVAAKLGPSPEDVFREASDDDNAPRPTRRRRRNPEPLEGPGEPEGASGPLG